MDCVEQIIQRRQLGNRMQHTDLKKIVATNPGLMLVWSAPGSVSVVRARARCCA
jgi:hypothetical protein